MEVFAYTMLTRTKQVIGCDHNSSQGGISSFLYFHLKQMGNVRKAYMERKRAFACTIKGLVTCAAVQHTKSMHTKWRTAFVKLWWQLFELPYEMVYADLHVLYSNVPSFDIMCFTKRLVIIVSITTCRRIFWARLRVTNPKLNFAVR